MDRYEITFISGKSLVVENNGDYIDELARKNPTTNTLIRGKGYIFNLSHVEKIVKKEADAE